MVSMSERKAGRRHILVSREITMQRFLKEPGFDIARIFPATFTRWVLSHRKTKISFSP
jgi:hypothetical protein